MALDSNDIAVGATIAGASAPPSSATDAEPRLDARQVIKSALSGAGRLISRGWISRAIGKSLRRRILLANLLGLAGLLFAMLYLSLHHGWLLDAKVDVVKTVSRITSEAIAYRAVNERAIFDPNRLPEKTTTWAQRDDAFAAFELPIDPHQAAVVLRKLVGPASLKARIYSTKGTLILNSETLFSDDPKSNTGADNSQTPRLKNFWTRLNYWVINKELKVYRELGTTNGFLYPEVKNAAQRGVETPILLLNKRGQQIVSMAEPIKRGNKILGVLLVSTKPGDIDDILWDERWLILQIAAMALLVAIGSSLVLERTVAVPMRRLSEAAYDVTQNISARQEIPDLTERRDEVGQTSRAFVAMTNALYRRIEGSERFAADVAHELKNPLAAARSTAEAMAYAKTDADRMELVTEIQSELKRLNRLINDISSTSRLDAELARQHMETVDVRGVLESINSLFTDMLADDNRTIALIIDPAPPSSYKVRGNDGRLGQVFTNLIDNALSFSPEGGKITVRARPNGSKIEITIEDEGPGIPPDKLGQIFDRFYSDRPQTDAKRGKNSGLGLSISREIVVSHHGEIFAENRPQNGSAIMSGARFTVRLPLIANVGDGLARRS
ncbi:integral membrane sensor signal transduction histidine kinase [Hyphomicrobium denitrificans ATCC 51888]|uniref:histidine kinase n=1 Tax=Hyphomicrobium denitrificans (strain ATCC 51888 / DSM 1869 / NCIMB 11706 / TK 0415) TaxID=582899 RepID=D8JRB2_HYPDA|nr:stimulus-sensing domain-containing protein [Hyphomicrobium denitrificans]ADJ24097.1 integral membrane sensor signal transduction histidine kinase [Hyphomicrobium denitrificans ATCC 51888]